MDQRFKRVFGEGKPVIGMVHLGALPGSPLYDEARGIAGLVEAAAQDLAALQAAGFDAVMFGNENDRPYEFDVDRASTATMSDLEAVKKVLPDIPVLANAGVKHDTVADVLGVADGCVVGSSLKIDGDTWKAVDPARPRDFMRQARA